MDRLSRITPAILDVLEVLVASCEIGCHGFAIAKDVNRPTGSVYPILARLEKAGWLESYWESEQPEHGRPRRRLYSLTSDGLLAANGVLAERRHGSAAILRPRLSLGGMGVVA